MQPTDLVPKQTVQDVVQVRNNTLDAYRLAYAAIERSNAAISHATEIANPVRGQDNRFNVHTKKEQSKFLLKLDLPTPEEYMRQATALVDRLAWSHLISMTDMLRLMDKKARDEFSTQLAENPPEITFENVQATLVSLFTSRGDIFKRGLAECFSALDRRFKSHDGWKMGHRVILNRAFNEFGMWGYHRDMQARLRDIERVFFILDGQESPPDYAGILGAIQEVRKDTKWGSNPQVECESDFFKIRMFKNGNLHIWFKRDDLLQKVNILLGEYYGAPLPDGHTDKAAGAKMRDRTKSVARYDGWFPTPDGLADRVIEQAMLWTQGEPLQVLEPSAGEGALVKKILKQGSCVVDCVEIDEGRVNVLRGIPGVRRVTQGDFLEMAPMPRYDRVIMNPPFAAGNLDIDHVLHAYEFLKPGGRLIAIMSASVEYNESVKARSFRELIQRQGGRFNDNPARSFASVGTNVNTVTLEWRK